MNINKTSWHYRLVTWNDTENAPRTLCPYFWKGVWNALLSLSVMFFIIFAGWGVGVDLATWLFAKCGVALTTIAGIVPGIIVGWLLIASALGIIFTISYGIHKFFSNRKERKEEAEWEARKNGTYVKPEPNIIWAFVKSRKQKYCPMLEFK